MEVGVSAGWHERSAVPHLQTSSVFALVCLTHRGQTRTKCPADQEALNFYSLHFHSHLSGISMMFIRINVHKAERWGLKNYLNCDFSKHCNFSLTGAAAFLPQYIFTSNKWRNVNNLKWTEILRGHTLILNLCSVTKESQTNSFVRPTALKSTTVCRRTKAAAHSWLSSSLDFSIIIH